jgi:hypothetical protein
LRRRRVRSFRRGMKSRRQVLFVAAVKLYGSPENAAGRPTTLPAPTTRVGYKWEEELTVSSVTTIINDSTLAIYPGVATFYRDGSWLFLMPLP